MISFRDGFVSGLNRFAIEGIVRTARLFDVQQAPGVRLIGPQSDDAIVVIDDPYAIDGTGLRAPFVRAFDFSRLSGIRDSAGTTAVDVWDGAALVLNSVAMTAGQTLSFEYCFVGSANPNSGGPELDVAVLELEAESGHSTRQVFADSGVLRAHNQWHTGWRVFRRRFRNGFHGTIRWICANGAIANPYAPAPAASVGARYPSALLLDFVEIA